MYDLNGNIDEEARLKLYMGQSKNVRDLLSTKKIFIKDINQTNRKGLERELKVKTKLLALLYCTYAEAVLYQVILTPYGVSKSKLEQIDDTWSVGDTWKELISVGLRKIPSFDKSEDLQNRERNLHEFIDKYVVPPSQIRNKMMHGQWVVALNKNRTKINFESTASINNLDYVNVGVWFDTLNSLAKIVRELIQSPTKGFHNNYWQIFISINEQINRSKDWNYLSKRNLMRKKMRDNAANNA